MTTETKVQHTPGPWAYKGQYSDPIITGASGTPVVELGDDGGCYDPECCGRPSYHVVIAPEDAHLIAASPLLLEALELALATIERLAVQHGPFNSAQGTMDVARQAIALAKGVQDAS